MPLLGAHVSISGGIYKAPQRGKDIGCDAIQIFSKNQMQWTAKPLTIQEAEKFKKELVVNDIKDTVIHTSYLINIGSPDKEKLEKSRNALIDEFERARLLGIPYIVLHPGSHMGKGEELGLDIVAESINYIFDIIKGNNTMLLLETTAGQGSNLGYKFEQIAYLIEKTKDKDRIGVCFDTCHIFAAGYDIRTKEAYEKTIREFDKIIGIPNLKAIHLNDSKNDIGTRKDRHEHIGKGYIGLSAFEFIVNDERFANIPMILETPGGEKYYRENLEILRSLIKR
ncbi:MAG TPA: deoxyribonuclease IV [Candidatus Atribacteria bacterium]|nr:deoxyribonuclease IV [Candidatus Atribacteria bacterium]